MHRQRPTHIPTDSATGARTGGIVTVTPIDARAGGQPVPDVILAEESADRHPTAIGRRLDVYLDTVVEALRDHGVLTGAPQRTDVAQRLVGTVTLDCAAVRIAAWRPTGPSHPERQSLGGAVHPGRPMPVNAVWDEREGWCVEFDDDPVDPTRRFLHPDLLPGPQTVADFVVALALGRFDGSSHPIGSPPPGRPHLRVVR